MSIPVPCANRTSWCASWKLKIGVSRHIPPAETIRAVLQNARDFIQFNRFLEAVVAQSRGVPATPEMQTGPGPAQDMWRRNPQSTNAYSWCLPKES